MYFVTQPMVPDTALFMSYAEIAFREKRFTNGGPLNSMLELRLRELIGAQHLALVSNGTVALELAIRALGIEGEIITTPFTFAASTHAIVWAACRPVFADIDEETLTLDPQSVERMIGPQTRAILPVHVYGHPCQVTEFADIAKRHDLSIVYDAAHAFNVSVQGRSIGAFGDASTYSFHATKVFHTAEGGAVETNSPALADRIEKLRNFGIAGEGVNELIGTNAKMSELSAALGLANLELLGGQIASRHEIHQHYRSRLAQIPYISLVAPNFPDSDFRSRYAIIRIGGEGTRDRLNSFLHSRGIVTRRYFYPLTSAYPMYRECRGAEAERMPVASRAAREVLALPFHGGLSGSDVDFICDCIGEFFKHE